MSSPPTSPARNRNRGSQRSRSGTDTMFSAQIALAAAQHVDMQIKVDASIKVGEKKWREIASDNLTLENCVCAVHNDIVAIWNIRDLDEFLLNDSFRSRMTSMVEDLYRQYRINNMGVAEQSSETVELGAGEAWTIHQEWPKHIRRLMAYTVDLVLILQVLFQISLSGDQFQGKTTPDRVTEVIYQFVCSKKKRMIHDSIIAFVENQLECQQMPASDDIENMIKSLIKQNEIDEDDMGFDLATSPLSSLLEILKIELSTRNVVNTITLDLMSKILDSPEHLAIATGLKADSDVELLLDFILCLLRDDGIGNFGTQDARQKARKLMHKLSKNRKHVLPRTLFISDVKTNLDKIDEGGFGTVYKGEHNRRLVALKMLYKPLHAQDLLRKDFCREALAWRSLSHQFILPLLGIYEEKSRLFLVSPFMTNGTLIQWRKNRQPGVTDIYRMMLEIAQGVHYIHSEGIVHGDLSGANVLLDSESRCKIADFGLSRHVEITITRTVTAQALHYTAPELFGLCSKCSRSDCVGCGENEQNTIKTMEADVYAVGCLYYAVFFGIVPYEGVPPFQIMWRVATGRYPIRQDNPKMSDEIWGLIMHCWSRNPSGRPTMTEIIEKYLARTLLTNLMNELTLSDSMVNEKTLDLVRQASDLSDDAIAFELKSVSNLELLLDFVFGIFKHRKSTPTNSAIQDAGRKARILMSKLISAINIVPSSLFITDVNIVDLDAASTAGFGYGFYKGQEVAVQRLYKGSHKEPGKDLLRRDPRRLQEILVCRSLSHRFILPLLGIHEEKSYLFLVTPFMANGTLTQWRRDSTQQSPALEDMIHDVMLEVALGVQYMHLEGVVHGNLHGGNVLIDSALHCQITGFVSSEQSDISVTPSSSTLLTNYAAPELFDDVEGDLDVQKRMQIDVYAFGCLYYAAFFDTIPFHGKNNFQIMRLVKSGRRPDRLEQPRIDDWTWNLIQSCWESDPSKRPTLEQIVETLNRRSWA